MRVFDFNSAIVRRPGASAVNGLRDNRAAVPNHAGIVAEHAAYIAALTAAGLTVDVLEPLEAFPDSVFVEDPALVFGNGAILLRPGAPTRLGERDAMRPVLQRHFGRVVELGDGEFADGGDVLVTPDMIFIGLSLRTNRAGADALVTHLDALGRYAAVVDTPRGVLHFKTGVSLLSETQLLATPAMAASELFEAFDVILTPAGEEAAANALRVNDTVFIDDRFARTIDLLNDAKFRIVPLRLAEISKLDAGLSCMSLRWQTAP